MITLEPPRNAVLPADAWAAWGLSRAGLSRFANVAQVAVGLVGGVDVLLAGDSRLRKLNREFRGKDKATDVLSFPAAAGFGDGHAGDLAISLETALRQAAAYGHSLRDEVRVLLLHGMLHLAGMDHEVDAGEMAAREAELRVRLRLPGGLIGRAFPVARKRTPGAKAPIARSRGEAKAEALAYLEARGRSVSAPKSRSRSSASRRMTSPKDVKLTREERSRSSASRRMTSPKDVKLTREERSRSSASRRMASSKESRRGSKPASAKRVTV